MIRFFRLYLIKEIDTDSTSTYAKVKIYDYVSSGYMVKNYHTDNKNEIHGATIVTPLGTANKKAGRKTPCVSRPALGKIALPFIEKNSYEPQDLELSYIFVICRPPQRLP